MSDLDVQLVLGSRYRTSHEADRITGQLMQLLGLSTKAQVARLSIGMSLALGALPVEQVDAKGMDIPATSLFTNEDIGAWVGLIVTHSIRNGGARIDSMEGFRAAVRAHWHRGVLALWDDWINSDQNYDQFITTLVTRRTDMPEVVTARSGTEKAPEGVVEPPTDESVALVRALDELGIKVQVKDSIHGPRVTRYRVFLTNLADSARLRSSMPALGIALNLGSALPIVASGDEARTLFIDLPRPKATWSYIGIERLREWAYSTPQSASQLLVYPGVSVTGGDVSFDLAVAPHLLVAGTTGSGKSVCLHSLILSLLLRHSAESLQLVLIDPKQVEFSQYAKIPHLYGKKIATEVPVAKEFLQELVGEMENRYTSFQRDGVTNIAEARRKGNKLPFVVIFIEEMADLILQDDSIETLIERLAQKARAAGIHLVLATQRPDAKTFSGLIRSNIPGRIALTVQKGTESNIILDEKGAENLLGAGDMLIRLPGYNTPTRVHGVFVRIEDVIDLTAGLNRH
jgi:DNA segregation ATPase FtsK/SpoIIIE, S-DNA-T family